MAPLDRRLTDAEPDIAAAISARSPSVQRNLAYTVVNELLTAAHIDGPDILAALKDGPYGDSDMRTRLEQAATAAEITRGQAAEARNTDEHKKRRTVARALSAAWHALSDNPQDAALEVVSEARFGLGKPEARELVARILGAHIDSRSGS